MTNKPIWTPYGPNAPVAGWSGLFNHVYGEQYLRIDSQNNRRMLGMALRNWGRYAYNQVIKTLVVGNVGDTAYAPGRWIKAQDPTDPFTIGGKRDIILHAAINRPTTAADQLAIQQDISFDNSPPWPVDKSGNGGGGRYL